MARWPGVKLAKNQATYLAWIDVSGLGLDDPVSGDYHLVMMNDKVKNGRVTKLKVLVTKLEIEEEKD